MNKVNYKTIPFNESPKLVMRYYKAEMPQKGILVFVHGVSHGAWCWWKFVDFFTKVGYACFVINLRGHGENDRNDIKGAKLSDYLTDVVHCVEYIKNNCNSPEINIQYFKPFIIGHSMGGAIVEMYIDKYSDEVEGAILFAPVTAGGMNLRILTTSFSIRGFSTLPTAFFGKKIFLSISNFFAIKNKILYKCTVSKADLEYSRKELCKESIRAMFGLWDFELKDAPNIPVFVIGSDKDAYFPIKSLNKTAAFYDTKPMILKGLCHDMMLDFEWEKAAQSVLEFINSPEKLKNDKDAFIRNLKNKIYPDKSK